MDARRAAEAAQELERARGPRSCADEFAELMRNFQWETSFFRSISEGMEASRAWGTNYRDYQGANQMQALDRLIRQQSWSR